MGIVALSGYIGRVRRCRISPPWPWMAAAVDAQQYDRVAATQESLGPSVTSLARLATDRADPVKLDHLGTHRR